MYGAIRRRPYLLLWKPLVAGHTELHMSRRHATLIHFALSCQVQTGGLESQRGAAARQSPDFHPVRVRLLLPSAPDGDSCAKLIRDLQRKENIMRFHFDHRQNRSPAQRDSDVWIDGALFFN